jgi:hypothetical protein
VLVPGKSLFHCGLSSNVITSITGSMLTMRSAVIGGERSGKHWEHYRIGGEKGRKLDQIQERRSVHSAKITRTRPVQQLSTAGDKNGSPRPPLTRVSSGRIFVILAGDEAVAQEGAQK